MKTITRSILLCSIALLLTLSPAPCRAVSPTYSHDFHEMYNTSKTLKLNDTYTIGTVEDDDITYTCSDGAQFFISGSKLAIFLVASGAQVVVSQIQNLDSMVIYYSTDSKQHRLSVEISENGVDGWKSLEQSQVPGTIAKSVKLPSAGDYYVCLKKNVDNMYIMEIDYYCLDLSACPNCFIYRPE